MTNANSTELDLLVKKYLTTFPEEAKTQEKVLSFLKNNRTYASQTDRTNVQGHVTASAIIVHRDLSKVLMIDHPKHKKPLPPGGHVELSDSSILECVYREVKEETGLEKGDISLISSSLSDEVPLDVNTHAISAVPDKNEPYHLHHDFRFLFLYARNDSPPEISPEDGAPIRWVPFSSAFQDGSHLHLPRKLRHALSAEFRTKLFYDAILEKLPNQKNVRSVVVSHIIPDCVYYLKAVNQAFKIDVVIPKPKSIVPTIRTLVEADFELMEISRDDLRLAGNALVELIRAHNDDVILFDIGGYFSGAQNWPEDVKNRIKVIIEDTENGHQKYVNDFRPSDNPKPAVISAARSPLKENEDFLVGQSVFFSADSLMRTGGTLVQYTKCSVFGYGKIGKSVAHHLLQRGIKPSVYDTKSLLRIKAFNEMCAIPSRDWIIDNSDVIFCATGNCCLELVDFRRLKNGCFVFSVTSSDDEMDLSALAGEYERTEVKPFIFKYSSEKNFFFLANDGNAVNFIHNAVMGSFIHLVRAEMLMATVENLSDARPDGIRQIRDESRELIAKIWLEVMDPENRGISSIEYIL